VEGVGKVKKMGWMVGCLLGLSIPQWPQLSMDWMAATEWKAGTEWMAWMLVEHLEIRISHSVRAR
jgi:hypothetical protein